MPNTTFTGICKKPGNIFVFKSLPAIFAQLERWAQAANAIILLEDGHVRDPSGLLLLAADTGQSEAGAQIPYPESAWHRKQRSDAQLQEWGIHVPAHMPPLIAESEVSLRKPQQVAERALALFLVALRAESCASGEAIPQSELANRLPLSQHYLSPAEAAYLAQSESEPQTHIEFCWRYESLALLLWALGKLSDLTHATAICDVSHIAEMMLQQNEATFLQDPVLRPTSEILDALDLHYRLHWAVRQSRQEPGLDLAGFDAGVIYERHYALNWLCQFEDADWDQVDTPT